MADTPPYSEATVELIFDAISDHAAVYQGGGEGDFACGRCGSRDPDHEARMVAAALSRSGLLLPEGAERQWSVRYPDGFVESPRFTRAGAEQHALELNGEVVWRPVAPWSSVPPKEPTDA